MPKHCFAHRPLQPAWSLKEAIDQALAKAFGGPEIITLASDPDGPDRSNLAWLEGPDTWHTTAYSAERNRARRIMDDIVIAAPPIATVTTETREEGEKR